MTGPPEEPKPKDPSAWIGPTSDRVASLSDYFLAGSERYTPQALRQAATDAGYSQAEIDEANALTAKRQRDEELNGPTRRRANRIVLAAYGLVLAAFAVPFLTIPSSFNVAHLALLVLAITLGMALLISRTWINGRHPSDQVERALLTMLAVPIVLLIALAGLCAASVGPSALGLS